MRTLPALLLLAAGTVHGQSTSPGPIPTPTEDWGCEVLLCLANPAGPEAVAQCIPPIERLWRALATGHAFPSCTMAQGPQGSGHAELRTSYYDPCPTGTTAAPPGQTVMLASATPPLPPPWSSGTPSPYALATPNTMYTGIGDGDTVGQDRDETRPPKICVSGAQGARSITQREGDVMVDTFDTVYTEAAEPSNRAIDVYIDQRLWQTVRW